VDSTALFTDHYELTMLQAALANGTAQRRCTFELFGRRLPDGRRYGVVAGTGRVLDAIENFTFDDQAVDFLRRHQIVDEDTCRWLAQWRFSGDVSGYAEGEVYFPGSPIMVVNGTFADCIVLETVLLSILNHDSAIASAAARMVEAAGDRPCVEMGSRRTHEEAAVAAARSAYIAGFSATSNLMARVRHHIPTTGTSAHAFTLLHDTERDAFRAQIESLGADTTVLRSEEHTSELQSRFDLVCRPLLEKKIYQLTHNSDPFKTRLVPQSSTRIITCCPSCIFTIFK